MARMPKFKRRHDGSLLLGYTKEADEVFKNSRDKPSGMSEEPEEVCHEISLFARVETHLFAMGISI